jgi:hypothetical protein
MTILAFSLVAAAGAALPLAEQAEFAPLKANAEKALKTLRDLGSPLPAETERKLNILMKQNPAADNAADQMQKLLDPYCLVGVTINPESRVKVARGDAKAELKQNASTCFLIKVNNQAGVTQPLRLLSPNLKRQFGAETGTDDPWLEGGIHAKAPMASRLNGQPVEYLVVCFSSRVAGKREAKLLFDVGQGTQDLGFRAETPILFTIRP